MSSTIKSNMGIMLTRGDTFVAKIELAYEDDTPAEVENGATLRFALKEDYEDTDTLILKDIPIDTMVLKLDPEDTKSLDYGTYVYDVQLTHANGDVDTVIPRKTLTLQEEVE